MPNIAVLLSTYNSTLYLRELLNSIISQTYEEWELYIRDDMSTDETVDIINEYTKKDRRVHLLYDNEKQGPLHSFMWLLKQVEAKFYMFCDHDDVWLPNKIEETYNKMIEQKDIEQTPVIVCADLKLVDRHLNIIAESYWRYNNYKEHMFNDRLYHLFYNNIPGCSMMVNKAARDAALPYPHNTIMHDYWMVIATLWNKGKVVRVEQPLILYRQHGDNTIGGGKKRSLWLQIRILPSLIRKGVIQFSACKEITGISSWRFFMYKVFYFIYVKINYKYGK